MEEGWGRKKSGSQMEGNSDFNVVMMKKRMVCSEAGGRYVHVWIYS